MLTVSGISSLKIVKFFNREQITTVHNHKRRYLFTMFVNSAQKNRCSRLFCETGNRKFSKPRWRQRPQRQFGPIALCIARDQWRWTAEVDLTRGSWVLNRDAQTGIMNLLLEGAFAVDNTAQPRWIETVDEARASETFQDCDNYETNVQTLLIISPGLIQLPKWFSKGLQPY